MVYGLILLIVLSLLKMVSANKSGHDQHTMKIWLSFTLIYFFSPLTSLVSQYLFVDQEWSLGTHAKYW